jgi:hypothetical protein
MADSVDDQNADGRGASDGRAQSNTDTQEPQTRLPVTPPDQQASNPTQPPTRRRSSKCRCNVGTIIEFFVGCALIGVGYLQYSVYTRQANIMEIEQRPWVSLESLDPKSDLLRENDGAHVSVGYKLKNVGHSPSFNTIFFPVVIPVWFSSTPGPTIFNAPSDSKATDSMIQPNVSRSPSLPSENSIAGGSRQLCEKGFEMARLKEQIKNLSEQIKGDHVGLNFISSGDAIFPDKILEREFRITPENVVKPPSPPAEAKSMALTVVACVRYEDQTGKPHYTHSVYVLFGTYPADAHFDEAFAMDQNSVPLSALRLRLGGQYAD